MKKVPPFQMQLMQTSYFLFTDFFASFQTGWFGRCFGTNHIGLAVFSFGFCCHSNGFGRCCRNSYRFITIYKSTYEFICLESHVNTEINLDLRVSNIPGSFAAERQTNQVEIQSTPNVVPLPVSTRTQTRSELDASAVEIKSQNLDKPFVFQYQGFIRWLHLLNNNQSPKAYICIHEIHQP